MANWTWNNVSVYGSGQELRNFKTLVTGEDSPFDFNRIVPMPVELEGTTAPSPQPNQRLLDLYGADNWYDWRAHNWGTNWEAGTKPIGKPSAPPAEQIDVNQPNEWRLEYGFYTPWWPPLGIYRALLAVFAGRVEIMWHFAQDPGEGQRGFLTQAGLRMWDNPLQFHSIVSYLDARTLRPLRHDQIEDLPPWDEPTDHDEPDDLPDNVLTADDDHGK